VARKRPGEAPPADQRGSSQEEPQAGRQDDLQECLRPDGQASGSPAGYDCVALVLQGGGALGSYQAGVYEGMHRNGLLPTWVAGISIGAINAAIIAGSPPDERVERLRGFWESICRPYGYAGMPGGEWLAALFQGIPYGFGSPAVNGQLAAAYALWQGQPGFFKPRFPPPYLVQGGGPQAASFYDTTPLVKTLETYIDFDLLNSGGVRVSLGAVNVRTGNFAYFDSTQARLTPYHVMASGALPPGFPAVEIDGEFYWDGGVVSNTPLYQVLSMHPMRDTLAFQVDLWPARGPLPQTLEQVAERQKDIQYSSRTRLVTDSLKRSIKLRRGLQRLLALLPEAQRNAPELADIRREACTPAINVVNLIYQSKNYERQSKDYEFGTEAMRDHWQSGLADVLATVARPGVLDRPPDDVAFVSHDIHRE
jgi:NTE family protein